jgi:hypothetical protein
MDNGVTRDNPRGKVNDLSEDVSSTVNMDEKSENKVQKNLISLYLLASIAGMH